MRIVESKPLLLDKNFAFDLSELTLTVTERTTIIECYKGIRYLFSDRSELEYKLFINSFLSNILSSPNAIYLFFSNRFLEKKDRIRSYQKLFYKEQAAIGPSNSKEIEVDLKDGHSMLLGMVKLEEANLHYLVERLFSSDFTFLFESCLDQETLFSDDFMKSVKNNSLIMDNMRYFNPLKTVLAYEDHMNFVARLQGFGNDDQAIEVIMKNKEVNRFVEIGKNHQQENEFISYN